MRMDQGSPASAASSSPSRMESTTLPQSPPRTEVGAPKSGAEPIILWKEGSMDGELALTPNGTSGSKIELPKLQARRKGAFMLEDNTPPSEFEEIEIMDASQVRFKDVPSRVEPFRIALVRYGPTGSPNATSSPTTISAEELTTDPNGTVKMVEMKCFICGAALQLPSYAALQKKCHLKCSSCDTGETHAKNWMDIILTALYNLEILHQRQYFHCKSEICAFIDHHWSSICPERARTPTWGNTVMSQISTHPELFQSHQRGSGYWALKRSSPLDKESAKAKEGEGGEKDVRGGEKRAENKNKRRTDLKVLGEEDEENQEYFIEEILSKRIRKGSVEYFVKWEGLADAENSWEKAQDIECSELVQDFESESRKNPLWKEGSGLCLKRKRKELDEKSEKKARWMSKKQTRIPVSQWCHQCLRHKPVVMCCDGVATGKCGMQYCERCLEKHYDEEIVVLQKAKGEWVCPRCRSICCCPACDPEKTKAKQKQPAKGKGKKEPAISRIIARCKVEGTNEWEYLVHYKGRAESENRWVRSTQMDLPPHLKKRYRNTLKMRVTNKKGGREPPTPEPRQSKTGARTRTPKGLRTSDFDISRVVFDDQVHRIVVPEKPEVATPAWRMVQDNPAATTTSSSSSSSSSSTNGVYGGKRESNGETITTEKIAGVVEIDASLRDQDDEGSSSEDTSDEAFTRRHSRYETVFNATGTPKARRRGSMAGHRKSGNKNNKGGGRREGLRSTPRLDSNGGDEEGGDTATTPRQSRERRNSRGGVERRRSDSQLMYYGSDDLAIPDVMRVEQESSVDQMDVVMPSPSGTITTTGGMLASSSSSSSASVPPTPTTTTPLTAISAT